MSEQYADDAQRYRLDSRIATGGMGEVWRATDTTLGREVALKLLKTEYADDPTFRERFEIEARHAAALHHPGVAGVFDVGSGSPVDGSSTPRPFLVMELVEGQPLSDLLRDGRDLDRDAVRDLMAQTGEALGAAHRAGIVHRDVKPANLMVTPDGTIKVTDFGIARALDGAAITRTGAVMGTPQYLSPEQARGETATPASDVYALGVVSFECLAGRRPFDESSPIATALAHLQQPVPELPDDVPADLAAVVRRALDKDPAQRYADGAAFAAALRDPATAVLSTPRAVPVVAPVPIPDDRTQVLAATPAAADAPGAPVDPTTTTPVADERSSSNPWPVVLVVVLLVALAVLATVLLTGGDDDDTATDPNASTPPSSASSSAPSSEPPSEPTTVDISGSDYEGRPVDDVQGDLDSLGLNPRLNELDNDGSQEEGIVESVNPTGPIEIGETIDVDYWGPPPEPTEEPTTEEPPSEEPTTEAPPSEEPTVEEPTVEAPPSQAPTTQAPPSKEPTPTESPTLDEGGLA